MSKVGTRRWVMIIMCMASFSDMPLSFMNFMESWNPCAMAARMLAMPTPARRLASASASDASHTRRSGTEQPTETSVVSGAVRFNSATLLELQGFDLGQ